MERMVYSVSQVNTYIQSLMDQDGLLLDLCIRGEISNYKLYPSGHHYFSLKDATGAIRCVMFKSHALRLRFRPENGMQVLAIGRVTVYPRDGVYQLYCTGLMPDGVGDLYVAFEQLKEKLAAQGLFDENKKQPIPRHPKTIALITSGAGAALRDMIRIFRKRYPLVHLRVIPVRVQGREAPPEIAGAIAYVNQWKLADLIITGRGGGSMEDLWAFNEEIVAHAIYRSEIPVISAVGHEPDVTISDYVADLRAATPSNGAELAVPDAEELKRWLLARQRALTASMDKQIKNARKQLTLLQNARPLAAPMTAIEERRLQVDRLYAGLISAFSQNLAGRREHCVRLAATLDALSPLKVLGRGYAIVKDSYGSLVRSHDDVASGDAIVIALGHGQIDAHVD